MPQQGILVLDLRLLLGCVAVGNQAMHVFRHVHVVLSVYGALDLADLNDQLVLVALVLLSHEVDSFFPWGTGSDLADLEVVLAITGFLVWVRGVFFLHTWVLVHP